MYFCITSDPLHPKIWVDPSLIHIVDRDSQETTHSVGLAADCGVPGEGRNELSPLWDWGSQLSSHRLPLPLKLQSHDGGCSSCASHPTDVFHACLL